MALEGAQPAEHSKGQQRLNGVTSECGSEHLGAAAFGAAIVAKTKKFANCLQAGSRHLPPRYSAVSSESQIPARRIEVQADPLNPKPPKPQKKAPFDFSMSLRYFLR